MGSPNKFGWLAKRKCYIPSKSHRASLRDPATASPCASASLLAQQKFDSAQDDRQWLHWVIFVRTGDQWSPLHFWLFI